MINQPVNPADARAIEEVLNRVAYLLDTREYGRLGEVFAPEISFDNPGRLTASGLDAVIAAFKAIATPAVSHHITNVVVNGVGDDTAECDSKALALRAGGEVTAAIYRDTVTRTDAGWRISARRISPLG
ncbi:nuclear transport factor 2 family protein [Micromonospora inyonensis]|uniref:SnoaL-like domain-containing protein n=1 Tax=Micromonospora inyonensis TaxID=47866 RepID=A0A1C6S830_9ACTN|nr:nuclear transport factor 2 family protein [Micromonospora inyonensis]SCL25629.1 SnoaL-like domain-containing protein [Micromonospora inyonensis]